MSLSTHKINIAFESFDRASKPGWKFPSKTKLYRDAATSLQDAGDSEKFCTAVYPILKKEWSVQRSPVRNALLPAPEIFALLMRVKKDFPRFAESRLRDFHEQQILDVVTILQRMATVKTKKQPSIMAISKFLHFWNPCFFVIHDEGVVRGWLFKHQWLRSRRDELARAVRARDLREALRRLNPQLSPEAVNEAVQKMTRHDFTRSLLQHNQEFYKLIRDGVPVSYKDAQGKLREMRARVIDFHNGKGADGKANNRFLAVRELKLTGLRNILTHVPNEQTSTNAN